MAKITNANATYDVTTNREDLADEVFRIEPADTPFISAISRVPATNVNHEWSLQELSSINTANARLEGDELSRAASVNPTRLRNICQISSRDATVTGTQRAVNPAGIDDMMAYQMSLKSLELRRDMEAIVLGNQGLNTGNATTPRTLRSLNSWIDGNGSRDATTGADSASETAAATDSSATRDFTETLLKDAILDVHQDGGNPNLIMVGPFNKQVFSTFTGRATARQNVDATRVQANATLYASDFGDIKVVSNRTMRERDAYVVDTTKAKLASLRLFEPQELGRIGDGVTRDLISEYTLEVCAPKAHGLIADLDIAA